jgi:hypothetical protein
MNNMNNSICLEFNIVFAPFVPEPVINIIKYLTLDHYTKKHIDYNKTLDEIPIHRLFFDYVDIFEADESSTGIEHMYARLIFPEDDVRSRIIFTEKKEEDKHYNTIIEGAQFGRLKAPSDLKGRYNLIGKKTWIDSSLLQEYRLLLDFLMPYICREHHKTHPVFQYVWNELNFETKSLQLFWGDPDQKNEQLLPTFYRSLAYAFNEYNKKPAE